MPEYNVRTILRADIVVDTYDPDEAVGLVEQRLETLADEGYDVSILEMEVELIGEEE